MASAPQFTKTRAAAYKTGTLRLIGADVKRNQLIYMMLLPVVLYYLIFQYGPLYGVQIAFKDYNFAVGVWASPWTGFGHFREFFDSYYFWRLIRNTLLINVYDVLFGFPSSIVLALLLNELRNRYFKRMVQTASYLPYFISLTVVVGMIYDFTDRNGLVNHLWSAFGFEPLAFMTKAEWFRAIYVGSGIWQHIGWGSIIYIAAISGIDPSLYEAATVDGAGRWKQAVHITLPGIMPTIVILFILRMGFMMTVGFEKIILMYNPLTYETADVISTYIYRKGILDMNYSFTSAVGLFNSVINFALLFAANSLSRNISENKLW